MMTGGWVLLSWELLSWGLLMRGRFCSLAPCLCCHGGAAHSCLHSSCCTEPACTDTPVLPRTAAKFDFNDFLKQYKMVTGMGNLSSLVKMLPGAGGRCLGSFLPLPLHCQPCLSCLPALPTCPLSLSACVYQPACCWGKKNTQKYKSFIQK
jgi:hypothetical protein